MDEEIPYRSPATAPSPDKATDNDDEDYSTLVEVEKSFNQAIEDLKKDFNSFDLKEGELSIKEQIAVRQVCYEILSPHRDTITSAIEAVKQKRSS